jgi:glycerol-1-phosphate dehydrogenase [NAD(P)+]
MSRNDFPVIISENAIHPLIEFCTSLHRERLALVADMNTYHALGQELEERLPDSGFAARTILLHGEEVVADANAILQVLLHANEGEQLFLAVGSGTITDIVRFVCHKLGADFVSVPTAPSMDGYVSSVASLVIEGMKKTLPAKPPMALFAHLPTLCAAPGDMIAAGFGDVIAKYTSLADWKLAHLLWDTAYDEAIAERIKRALRHCAEHAEEIGKATTEGVHYVMEGLLETGFCIRDFGTSQPASGSEHHLSHYWEMKRLREKKHALLHGAKVGLGALLIAEIYQHLRQMDQQQVKELLEATPRYDRQEEIGKIKRAFDEITEQNLQSQYDFLCESERRFEQLRRRIITDWEKIQKIAESVPTPESIRRLLKQVRGPSTFTELGLSQEEVSLALCNAHYLRANFTVLKLSQVLHLPLADLVTHANDGEPEA